MRRGYAAGAVMGLCVTSSLLVACGFLSACGSNTTASDAAVGDVQDTSLDATPFDAPIAQDAPQDAVHCDASLCEASCVDLSSDLSNCGMCGNSCPASSGTVATCTAGACSSTCLPGYVTCNGGCVDLAGDSSHCGACNHDCEGGSCQGGRCQPVALSTNEIKPRGLAIDDNNVFWLNFGPFGEVKTCAKTGCGNNPAIVAAGEQYPNVFNLSITATPGPGGNVFWGSNSHLRTCPKTGCPKGAFDLASGSGISAIVGDGTDLFWVDGFTNTILKCNSSSCPGPTVLASGQSSALGISVDNTDVYWADASQSRILRCAKSGCAGNPTVFAWTLGFTAGVAVDATDVYWIAGSTIASCPKTGCNGPATPIATGQQSPQYITTFGGDVFWSSTGAVTSCSKTCINPVKLATVQNGAEQLAADSSRVYWVTRQAGTVMKVVR